jgi:hypothetical protein
MHGGAARTKDEILNPEGTGKHRISLCHFFSSARLAGALVDFGLAASGGMAPGI